MKKNSKRYLKVKGFYHLFKQNPSYVIKALLRRPFLYFKRFISSFSEKRTLLQEGVHLYGFKKLEDLKRSLASKESLLILGFSYCQRPKNCPAIRFSNTCPIDQSTCSSCSLSPFIKHLRKDDSFIVIAKALDLGEKILNLQKKYPQKEILFALSVCDLSEEIFSNFSHILGAKGVSFSLNGNTCTNFKSFQLAEEGKKKNTTYLDDMQNQLLQEFLFLRKETE